MQSSTSQIFIFQRCSRGTSHSFPHVSLTFPNVSVTGVKSRMLRA